jgi:hypothetical protein
MSVLGGQKQRNSYLELPSGAEAQPVCATRLYAYRSPAASEPESRASSRCVDSMFNRFF